MNPREKTLAGYDAIVEQLLSNKWILEKLFDAVPGLDEPLMGTGSGYQENGLPFGQIRLDWFSEEPAIRYSASVSDDDDVYGKEWLWDFGSTFVGTTDPEPPHPFVEYLSEHCCTGAPPTGFRHPGKSNRELAVGKFDTSIANVKRCKALAEWLFDAIPELDEPVLVFREWGYVDMEWSHMEDEIIFDEPDLDPDEVCPRDAGVRYVACGGGWLIRHELQFSDPPPHDFLDHMRSRRANGKMLDL